MMVLLFLSCTSAVPMNERNNFSPALVGIIHSLKWRYKKNCTGIEAQWHTALPPNSAVQVMMGPKTQNPHFDDDALLIYDTMVNEKKEVQLNVKTPLPSQETFINLRVWGHSPHVHTMLLESQNQGGFSVAESPDGSYGWAETTVSPCAQ